MYESPKLHTHMGGYETIRYKTDDGVVNVRHHRLIAVAEYGFDAVVDHHVHHKNKFTWDNRLSNLELLTPSEHLTLHGLERDPDPPDVRKLTFEEEKRIIELYETGEYYQRELGEMFGVTQRTISSIVNKTGCSLHAKLTENS